MAAEKLIAGKTRREMYEMRLSQLIQRRSTWEPAWRDIAEQMLPYRILFDKDKENRGEKKESKIINPTPSMAIDTNSAGMIAGITNPSRKWRKLGVVDYDDNEAKDIQEYLDVVDEIIEKALLDAGWYTVLSDATWPDLAAFGTSAVFHEETPDGGMRFVDMPIGQYYLDIGADGDVDTCYRILHLNVREMAQKFGVKAMSDQAQQAWNNKHFDADFEVIHAVQPNSDYSGLIGEFPYKSCWWERTDPNKERFLRESGYLEFPVLTPRWSVRHRDVYGRGPGWKVRGSCRALQHYETKLTKMVDKTVDPPMRGRGLDRASLLPGDMTHLEEGLDGMFEPAMQIPPAAISSCQDHINRLENHINRVMSVDLWRSIIDDTRAQRATAEEVRFQREQLMLMLGPLLTRMDNDLLKPAVVRTYNILERTGQLPPPPESLRGRKLEVKFISIMHQMQQATGLVGLRTMLGEVTFLANLLPEVRDKINGDAIVDEYAQITGVPAKSILSDKEVAQIRAQRAEQERVQQEGAAMVEATKGAKNLQGADPQQLTEALSTVFPMGAQNGVTPVN